MKLFNRILLALVLAAIFVFALFTSIYAFMGRQYGADGLPSVLALPENARPAGDWLRGFEQGNISPLTFAVLVLLGVVGIVLLILEWWPWRSPSLAVGEGLRVERKAVEKEVERLALAEKGVLASSSHLGGRRHAARLSVSVTARRGEEAREVEERVRAAVGANIFERGQFPVEETVVKVEIVDPRSTKRRVK